MGLLDGFIGGQFDADPEKNAQIKRGLLDFGLNMLAQGNRPTGEAFGRAGLLTADMRREREQQTQQAQRQKLHDQLLQGQVQQAQRQQRVDALPQQFLKPHQSFMDDRDVGQPGEPQARPEFDMQGYGTALMGLDPMAALQWQQATQKAKPKPVQLGANERLLDPETFKEMVPAMPGADKQSGLGQLIAEMNALPPGHPARRVYQDAINKQTTHGPGMNVSFGAPMPAVNPKTGEVELLRPDNKGGMSFTGVKPPPQDRDIRMTEAQAKAATFKSQMDFAERELAAVPIDQTSMRGQVETGLAGGWTNPMVSASAQRARQAQEQWSEAFLRFKTGAATTKDEVRANVRTFFPRPGDSPEVIEQKKRARAQASKDLAFAAGGGGKPGAAPAAPADEPKVRRFNPATGRIE